MESQLLFVGAIIHSEEKEKLTILENAAILIENGKIIALDPTGNVENIKSLISNCKTIHLEKNEFLCPGFIDTHVHAAQYPNIGLGYDKSLLDWLKTYTFPLEMKYSDVKFANEVYSSFVKATLSCGTTTACYYSTIHTESAVKLAEIVSHFGQRAIVGKVNMNRNSMDNYVEETDNSLKETEKFITEVKKLENPLVQPAVTPRFAISCDMKLLKGLGQIAKKYDCYIQTHISENTHEVAFVKDLFPENSSYAQVYEEAGLLTEKTILGHGIYLSGSEMKTLSKNGTAIAHCPNSNTMLQSGICPVRDLWNANVKVGLGTDVSGGSSPSILEVLRHAIVSSTHLSFAKEGLIPLSYHEAFYLATLGGAEAISMEDKIGNFKVGKDFDALLVQMNSSDHTGVFSHHGICDMVQKFIHTGDDRSIKKVYVRGKLVKESAKIQNGCSNGL